MAACITHTSKGTVDFVPTGDLVGAAVSVIGEDFAVGPTLEVDLGPLQAVDLERGAVHTATEAFEDLIIGDFTAAVCAEVIGTSSL